MTDEKKCESIATCKACTIEVCEHTEHDDTQYIHNDGMCRKAALAAQAKSIFEEIEKRLHMYWLDGKDAETWQALKKEFGVKSEDDWRLSIRKLREESQSLVGYSKGKVWSDVKKFGVM